MSSCKAAIPVDLGRLERNSVEECDSVAVGKTQEENMAFVGQVRASAGLKCGVNMMLAGADACFQPNLPQFL